MAILAVTTKKRAKYANSTETQNQRVSDEGTRRLKRRVLSMMAKKMIEMLEILEDEIRSLIVV